MSTSARSPDPARNEVGTADATGDPCFLPHSMAGSQVDRACRRDFDSQNVPDQQ